MVNNMHERNAGYLTQLMVEKEMLKHMPWKLQHAGRLLDQEIARIQVEMGPGHALVDSKLPPPEGPIVTLREKVFIPKDPPNYNYVGRILGPRGLTAKDLELKTGTKIQIRGRGSLRDERKEAMNRGKEGWEHLNEDLHVSVECTDTANRAQVKLDDALKVIKELLPDGMDDLKRTQLMHLAFIEGTYTPNKGKGHHPFNTSDPALCASTPLHQDLYPADQGIFSAYNISDLMYSPTHQFSPIPSPFGPHDMSSIGRPDDSYESFTSPLTVFSPSSLISSPSDFEKLKRRTLTIKPTSNSGYQTPKSSRSFKFNQTSAMESPNWRAGNNKDTTVPLPIEHLTLESECDSTNDLAKRLMQILDEDDVAQMASKSPTLDEFLNESEAMEDDNSKHDFKTIIKKP